MGGPLRRASFLFASLCVSSMKRCARCKETKEISQFYSNKSRPDSRDDWCKSCRKAYRKSHPKSYSAEYQRKRKLKLYGMTEEEWQRLSKLPCPICLKTGQTMCIDHDHTTGKARGVLCSGCNRALGLLGDSIESVERARAYLNILTTM